jgi:hypothetical protein
MVGLITNNGRQWEGVGRGTFFRVEGKMSTGCKELSQCILPRYQIWDIICTHLCLHIAAIVLDDTDEGLLLEQISTTKRMNRLMDRERSRLMMMIIMIVHRGEGRAEAGSMTPAGKGSAEKK